MMAEKRKTYTAHLIGRLGHRRRVGSQLFGGWHPAASPYWGNLVAEGRDVLDQAWWIAVFPSMAIMLVVLSFNLFGAWRHLWPAVAGAADFCPGLAIRSPICFRSQA